MKAKLTNLGVVVVLVLAFTMYVAGLGTDGVDGGSAAAAAVDERDLNGDGSVTAEEADAYALGERVDRGNEVGAAATGTATPTRTPTPINVGNFVWDDVDRDGRQDVGEPGMAGVTVQLWNSDKNDLLDQATTNASGGYSLTAPTPGSYRVRVLLPNPALDEFSPKDIGSGASPDQNDSDINPTGTNLGFTDTYVFGSNLISITSIDAGIIKYRTPTPTRTPTPINVGNFVWDDVDQDGRQDAGEPGIAGVTVQLWNAAMNDLIDQATTNASGIYSLTAPTPGSYRVRVLLPSPALDTFSPKDVGSGDNPDLNDSDINPSGGDLGFTDTYVFGSNLISITSIDAGIIKYRTPTPTRTPTPVNIGNFVWRDTNSDGIQDPGEPGIAGVVVQLWNSSKSSLLDTATTGSTGTYTVTAPTPGDYRIRVILPPGATGFSPKDVGSGPSPDQTDSDVNPSGPDLSYSDTFTIATNVISTTTRDAGILPYVVPTGTPTNTPTETPTPTPTNTPDPLATPTATPTATPVVPAGTPEPTSTPDEGPTVEPTGAMTSSPTPGGGVGSGTLDNDPDGDLPRTGGARTEQLVLMGLGLACLGVGLVLSTRRRPDRP